MFTELCYGVSFCYKMGENC